jgi:hypothetical protein
MSNITINMEFKVISADDARKFLYKNSLTTEGNITMLSTLSKALFQIILIQPDLILQIIESIRAVAFVIEQYGDKIDFYLETADVRTR